MNTLRSLAALALLALVLSSCAPHHRRDMERIDSLRVEAEGLVKAQSLMGFNAWAYGAEANQDSLYQAHRSLFTAEHIALVRRASEEEPDSLQAKRLRYFLRYLTTEFISKEVAPLTDRAANLEARATVSIDGKDVPYRQVGFLIANEKSPARRALFYRAEDPVLDSLNTILRDVEQKTLELTHTLGYSSYRDMVSELRGYSLDSFQRTAEEVLTATDSLYNGLLREMLKRYLRLDPRSFRASDRGPLFRNSTYDRYFPGPAMLGVLTSTYQGLGVDIPGMKNLTIDAEPRPAKNPRAVCYAIDVPADVRLSIKPLGGADDYAALFHEMGHAVHYASTRETSFEFRYAGEPTLTETYAFLSEYILVNQAWLRIRHVMPTPALKDFVRFQAFYRLYYVRRYCAKFLYELQLHAGVAGADSLYETLQCKAVGFVPVPSDAKRYLTDVDALYYSAAYLRAWFLEAQLNAALSSRYGVNWFENPLAGDYLRSLWALGHRLNGDELVRSLGSGTITPDAWLTEIRDMVRLSLK